MSAASKVKLDGAKKARVFRANLRFITALINNNDMSSLFMVLVDAPKHIDLVKVNRDLRKVRMSLQVLPGLVFYRTAWPGFKTYRLVARRPSYSENPGREYTFEDAVHALRILEKHLAD